MRAPATPLPWNNAYALAEPKDERYAVHACNAYPKLVAALRDLRRDEALDDDDAKLLSTRSIVDALLRELGELA